MPNVATTFLPVGGDPAWLVRLFTCAPETWLAASRCDGDAYVLTLPVAGSTLRLRTAIGTPWRVGSTHWRMLSCDPDRDCGPAPTPGTLLACLDGELGLHVDRRGRVTLILDARCQLLEERHDTTVEVPAPRHVVCATTEHLLEEVATGLLTHDPAPVTGERLAAHTA